MVDLLMQLPNGFVSLQPLKSLLMGDGKEDSSKQQSPAGAVSSFLVHFLHLFCEASYEAFDLFFSGQLFSCGEADVKLIPLMKMAFSGRSFHLSS